MSIFYGLLYAVAGSLLAAMIWFVVGDRLLHALGCSSFDLSGIWLAVFKPISPCSSLSIELVTIRHSRDTVRFHIENHNNVRSPIVKLKGLGKYRSSQLSAIYYFTEKDELETGTLVLRSVSTDSGKSALKGVYTQVADRDTVGDVSIRFVDYTLMKIQLPIAIRIRRFCFRSYFKNFEKLKEWLESAGIWDIQATICTKHFDKLLVPPLRDRTKSLT